MNVRRRISVQIEGKRRALGFNRYSWYVIVGALGWLSSASSPIVVSSLKAGASAAHWGKFSSDSGGALFVTEASLTRNFITVSSRSCLVSGLIGIE